MDKVFNHVNQSKLSFSCGAGAAEVNVFSGRVLFEAEDLSVGVNSFEISIGHIYDSQPVFLHDNSYGNGWRLSVQQYLQLSAERDENNRQMYLYIDSYGYVHKFEKLNDVGGESKYFDQTGLGLTLSIGSACYIENAQGGRMYFADFNGVKKLCRIVSGRNAQIVTHIDFDENGKIKSVYDGRKTGRKFEFTYNELSGLLNSIICAANNTKVEYTYNPSGDLVMVKKTVASAIKYQATYSYYDNLMKYAVNPQDGTSLQFVYDEYGRALCVSDGVMTTELNFSKPLPALFASSGLFSGAGNFCGQQERKFLGYRVSADDSDFEQGETSYGLEIGSAKTTIKNGKGVETTYFFNQRGFTSGILERSAAGHYRTLFKQTGIRVTGHGLGDRINGNRSETCTESYTFPNDRVAAANDYFKSEINKKNYDYVLSFWVKLNCVQTQNVKARITVNHTYWDVRYNDNGFRELSNPRVISRLCGGSLIDCTAKDGWQYVTVPFSYEKDKEESFVYKKFTGIGKILLDGVTGTFDIADARVTPGRVPVLTLTDNLFRPVLTLEQVDSINYTKSDNTVGGGAIRKDFFMTDSDITQTCMEMIKSREKANSVSAPYTLVCNAGTKRIANVIKTTFSGDGQEAVLGYTGQNDANYSNKYFCTANYMMATEPSSGDNRTYSYTSYFVENGKIEVVRQHTNALKYPDGAVLQKESDEYTWQNNFGDELKKRDAYGVVTQREYDEYGNLTNVTLSGSGTTEKIIEQYIYSADKEVLVAKNNKLPDGSVFAEEQYETDPLYGTLTTSVQPDASGLDANSYEYSYNELRDRLQKVSLKINGVEYGANTLTYGEDGRLKEVSPSDNCKYAFEYDSRGNATKFSLNGVALLTKEYDYAGNSVTAKYHRSDSITDEIKTSYDKYGRLKGIKHNNSAALSMNYQDEEDDFEESPSCANIKSMHDSCIDATYTYDYDRYTGRLTQYTCDYGDMNMKVFSSGSDKIKYEFDCGGLDYEEQTIYDEDCLISPRIKNAKYASGFNINWQLGYDALGRLSTRSVFGGSYPSMTVKYKSGTALKNEINYSYVGSSFYYTEAISQTYDARGNILTIRDEYSFGAFDKTDIFTYSYDDANRIISEQVSGLCNFSRTYTYDNEGNIATVTQGGETETYNYSQGRLVSITECGGETSSFSYDRFGNPVSYKGKSMTWERGTFLKSYNGISLTYDAQCKLSKKTYGDNNRINYYDGNKLVAQKLGDTYIRYFYDLEGVAGFRIDGSSEYLYAKDVQGNIVGLFGSNGALIAKYVYDAFGNCKILNSEGNEVADGYNLSSFNAIIHSAAAINPFRWKGQYYDADLGMYLISQRWYDPETGRYISSASPEMLIENASVIFALNLYAFCTANPLAVIIAASTFLPELDFYYNGEYKTWWEKNSWWVWLIVGVVATIVACVAAPFMCGVASAAAAIGTTLLKIAVGTAVGAAVSLAIGGTIAGIQAALTGHGFWEAFGESVTENFVDALVTSFAFTALTVAAGNLIKTRCCFKEGTLVETENGLKPIEEIEVGDKVLAYDETTGEQAYKPVVQLFRNTTKEWQYVYLEGETEPIISTPGHKYYLPNNNIRREEERPLEHASYYDLSEKWVSACKLKKGDKVLLSDGKYGIVKQTVCVHLTAPETTYNLEVADFHTYYVSDSKILVHNRKCGGKQNRLKEISQDDKLSKTIRNEIIQDYNKTGRYHVPKGYELRHRIGREAFKGYDYSYTDLQLKSLHKTQTYFQRKLGLLGKGKN